METRRDERKRRVTELRQQQILNAALTVFSQRGFSQATIAEIAQEAGIAEGTIYNYYNSKRDLLVSLVTSYLEAERVIDVLKHPSKPTDLAFLQSLIWDRLEVGFTNVERLLVLMGEIYHDSALRQLYVEQFASPTLELLEKYIESGIGQGGFRPLNTAVASRALIGMVIGLTLIHNIEGETGPLQKIPRKDLGTEVAKILLEGIQRTNKGG